MAGYDAPNSILNRVVGTAIRKGQCVKLDAGLVIPCSVAGEQIFGIALNGGAAGDLVAICVEGECDAESASTDNGAAGALTVLMTNADGRLIPRAAPADFPAAIAYEVGRAVASSIGPLFRVKVYRYVAPQVPGE